MQPMFIIAITSARAQPLNVRDNSGLCVIYKVVKSIKLMSVCQVMVLITCQQREGPLALQRVGTKKLIIQSKREYWSSFRLVFDEKFHTHHHRHSWNVILQIFTPRTKHVPSLRESTLTDLIFITISYKKCVYKYDI